MRRLASGLVASVLALAACQAGDPGTTPRPGGASPSPRAARAPGATATATPPGATAKPGTPATAGASYQKLQRPAGAAAVIKGRLQLDATYMVAAGAGNAIQVDGQRAIAADGGTLIGQDGGSLVANGRNQIVAAGAGNVIATTATLIGNAGNTLIGLDGGSLVGNNGNALVGNAGNTLVGNAGNTYHLAQAPAGDVVREPVVGALVGAIDLRTGQPVSLGKDKDGKDVFLVYSNASGDFELFLPPDIAKNVLVVAAPPNTKDGRLAVNVLVAEKDRGAVAADELRSLITYYLRACVTARLTAGMLDPDPVKSFSDDDAITALVATVLPDIISQVDAAGFRVLPPAAQHRAVQAGVDRMLANLDLGEVTIPSVFMKANPYGDNALSAMRRALEEVERRAGERPLAPTSDIVACANQLVPADRPWKLTKPNDVNDMLVRSFVIREHDGYFDLLGLAAMEMGADQNVEDAINAAGLAFFQDLAFKFFASEEGAKATTAAVVAATRAEVAAKRADPPLGPPPAPPAAPSATAALFTTLPGEPPPEASGETGRKWPTGLVLDERQGKSVLYAADFAGGQVWRIDDKGVAAPLYAAGNQTAFSGPFGLALGKDGELYVADRKRHAVYVVRDPGGTPALPELVAGRPGTKGLPEADAVPGAAASFDAPMGLVVGPDGALYVAEYANHVVRRIDLSSADRRTSVWAGGVDLVKQADGTTKAQSSFLDDVGRKARLRGPAGLAFGKRGLYVADHDESRLRLAQIAATDPATQAGPVGHVAGGMPEKYHKAEGPAYGCRLRAATAVAIDPAGRAFWVDAGPDPLRALLPGAWVRNVVGIPAGTLKAPSGLAMTADGKTLYVANAGDRRIHKVALAP